MFLIRQHTMMYIYVLFNIIDTFIFIILISNDVVKNEKHVKSSNSYRECRKSYYTILFLGDVILRYWGVEFSEFSILCYLTLSY